MKQINVYFDDKEYKRLIEKKDGLSWREFILLLIGDDIDINDTEE